MNANLNAKILNNLYRSPGNKFTRSLKNLIASLVGKNIGKHKANGKFI